MHDGKHSFYKYGVIKKYDPTNSALEDYNYDENFTERSDYSTVTFYGEELDDFPPLEGDKEVKERKYYNSKQTNNQAPGIISTNQSWK